MFRFFVSLKYPFKVPKVAFSKIINKNLNRKFRDFKGIFSANKKMEHLKLLIALHMTQVSTQLSNVEKKFFRFSYLFVIFFPRKVTVGFLSCSPHYVIDVEYGANLKMASL